MERIKRFLLDESGSSEAVSSVVLIASVGFLLIAALAVYYGAIDAFFGRVKGVIDGWNFGTLGSS